MSVEFKTIDLSRRQLTAGDTGILVQTKPKPFIKNPPADVITWLQSYADEYWKAKTSPEMDPEEPDAAIEKPTEDVEKSTVDEEKSTADEEKPAAGEEKSETTDEKPAVGKKESVVKKTGTSLIKFVARDLSLDPNLVFVSTNLVNPSDYLHFVFDKMTVSKGERRTKYPMRAMPVFGVSFPKPREMEDMIIPILEELIGDQEPYRFSLQFYGSMDADNMTQKEASDVVRNCIWAVNPNCILCLKHVDFAFTIDILKPFFCFGYLLDFIKLRRYKSMSTKLGYDLSGETYDSDDDISDDPALSDVEEKNRKLKMKIKRQTELANLARMNGQLKKNADDSLNDTGEWKEIPAENGNEDD